MSRERRLFSEEFKREAVRLASQPGANKSAIARDLGIGANLREQAKDKTERDSLKKRRSAISLPPPSEV